MFSWKTLNNFGNLWKIFFFPRPPEIFLSPFSQSYRDFVSIVRNFPQFSAIFRNFSAIFPKSPQKKLYALSAAGWKFPLHQKVVSIFSFHAWATFSNLADIFNLSFLDGTFLEKPPPNNTPPVYLLFGCSRLDPWGHYLRLLFL